ncbi:MAG: peptidyl-prolyl cis-trans isomerase, partial [Calditrichaeota bacterium]|nr:peptidyl-prolyl cis-trans isomerase [Calditrichota bacterium]
ERIAMRLEWVRRQAMREQLYRKKVKEQVQVSEAELRQAFVRRHTTLQLRHLVAPSEEEAWRLRSRLAAGESFEAVAGELPPPPGMVAQSGRPIACRWGELDPDFEAAAYELKVGELSAPVKTAWGHHIIRLEDVSRDGILTEDDFQAERRSLERIIRARKEDKLARDYAAGLLRGVQARVNGELFAYLVNTARAALKDSAGQLPGQLPVLQDEEIGSIASALHERMDQVFVSMGERQWTLRDFLRLVQAMPLDQRPHMHRPNRFRQELQDLIRDEFLADQAAREGMAKQPEVKAEVERWRRILLAARMRSLLTDTVSLNDQELRRYYAQRQERYRLTTPLEQLTPQAADLLREDALRAKADSVVASFVAQLRARAKIRENPDAYQRAFAEVGGHQAAFIKVMPVKP